MNRLLVTIYLVLFSLLTFAQNLDTLVGIGTHRLHFNVLPGVGTPILFEAGNGDDATVWQPVLEKLRAMTNAPLISYDRAGLGRSELDTNKISMCREIKNLRRALKKLGYRQPLLIVSHSFGGNYATLYANKYPRQVQGIVFIDPALPCFMTPAWSRDFIKQIGSDDWQIIKQYKTGLYYVLQRLPENMEYISGQPLPAQLPFSLLAADNPPRMVKPSEVTQWRNCLTTFSDQPQGGYVLVKGSSHKIWESNLDEVVTEIIKLYNKTN